MKTEEVSFFTQVIEALKQLFLLNPLLGILCSLLIVIFLLLIFFLLGVIFKDKDEPILNGVLNVFELLLTIFILALPFYGIFSLCSNWGLLFGLLIFFAFLFIGVLIGTAPDGWKWITDKLFKRKNKDTDNKS